MFEAVRLYFALASGNCEGRNLVGEIAAQKIKACQTKRCETHLGTKIPRVAYALIIHAGVRKACHYMIIYKQRGRRQQPSYFMMHELLS